MRPSGPESLAGRPGHWAAWAPVALARKGPAALGSQEPRHHADGLAAAAPQQLGSALSWGQGEPEGRGRRTPSTLPEGPLSLAGQEAGGLQRGVLRYLRSLVGGSTEECV